MKTIEESFQIKLDENIICVTARNRFGHKFIISSANKRHEITVTTKEIKTLANFLNETAKAIDEDEDFNQKNSPIEMEP